MSNIKKTAIIGVGNILFCDEGVGVFAALYLQKNFEFTPSVDIIDGGTLGFGLFEYLSGYDHVIIIDTISAEAKAGEIFRVPSRELLGLKTYKNTAHEVEVLQMLELCELYDKKAEITVFGIVPYDIKSVKIGLSEVLHERVDMLIETIVDEMKKLGVEARKSENLALDDIIEELVSSKRSMS